MRETNHGPLPSYLLQSTQEKLTESARLFDLSKHWLDDGFARGVDGRSHLGLQFSPHVIGPEGKLGKLSPYRQTGISIL